MNKPVSIGKQIKQARLKSGFTQTDLAIKCNLNLRTIQRVEIDAVIPRSYTLKIIGEVLNIDFFTMTDDNMEKDEIIKLRHIFRKRKKIRLALFYAALGIMFLALILIISGIPKMYWAPFIYISMFAILIGIGISWRCPGCNKLLGDVFNTRFCSHCGLKFDDEP